jgi:guanine deaminase
MKNNTSDSADSVEIYGYKGNILHFIQNPAKNDNSYVYIESGILYVAEGKIVEVGKYTELKNKYQTAIIIDYSGKLIMPGFIDIHSHYAQTGIIASYGAQLSDWLDTYAFPSEKKFNDPVYAKKIANLFIDQLINNGTTTALVFTTTFSVSAEVFFQIAAARNMRMISGKVLMDCNAPKYLLDNPIDAYNDSKQLIKKWHNNSRLKYALSLRFAPTSTKQELEVVGQLLQENPAVYLHTHLAENKSEVQWVHSLFPQMRSYLAVYDYYGLVGKYSIFAHSIYLDQQDYMLLEQKESAVAFCPTANLFLGSGLFDLNQVMQHNITVGFGTDIGAGTSFSMLQTMSEAYKVIQLSKAFTDNNAAIKFNLDPFQAFYMATLGGAKALHLDDVIGNFTPGKEADFIVIDLKATQLMAARIGNSDNLRDTLFALIMLGDDRAIQHTYIMGKMEK